MKWILLALAIIALILGIVFEAGIFEERDMDDKDYLRPDIPLPDSYLIKKRLSVHLERRRGSLTDALKEHASMTFSYLMRPDTSADHDQASGGAGTPADVYGFRVRDLNGNEISLDQYRGFVLLIVNVASECGLTQINYDHLNYLNERFHDKGLRILAFPCNQFGGQEPGSAQQIADFLEENSVKFETFSKIDVNGDGAHPLFLFLQKELPGSITNAIKWNFTKFLVNRRGFPVDRFAPTTPPKDMEENIIYHLDK